MDSEQFDALIATLNGLRETADESLTRIADALSEIDTRLFRIQETLEERLTG